MNNETPNNVLRELECISRKCITGDITVAVFDILKTTEDLPGLCKELGIMTQNKRNEVKKTGSLFNQLLNAGIELE